MLTFVGLGLYDERDITLKGLEAVRNADIVFLELYTSPLAGRKLETMQAAYGKTLILVDREDLEERAGERILAPAKQQNAVLLSGGDAMVATTHIDLRLRAIDLGIETKLIHAPSIGSAVAGICGLQNYRFGKSATISPPYRNVISEVPYDTVRANRERGLHTLLFLDLGMRIPDAVALLEAVEAQRNDELLKDLLMVGIARAGSETLVVKAEYPKALKQYDFGDLPHILVVPGELHFMEREALIKLAHAPL